ncbi:hypothetical protein DFH11DRAFT_1166555 [Phellopilus nigrolimitatus]|nr:hypothetical protein DFH11DRAFT_1166555 [Phellopilus nigrolimitatus]
MSCYRCCALRLFSLFLFLTRTYSHFLLLFSLCSGRLRVNTGCIWSLEYTGHVKIITCAPMRTWSAGMYMFPNDKREPDVSSVAAVAVFFLTIDEVR